MGLDLEAKDDESLLQLLLGHDIEISHSCGGMGSCGTCRVYVDKPQKLPPEMNSKKKWQKPEALQKKKDFLVSCAPQ